MSPPVLIQLTPETQYLLETEAENVLRDENGASPFETFAEGVATPDLTLPRISPPIFDDEAGQDDLLALLNRAAEDAEKADAASAQPPSEPPSRIPPPSSRVAVGAAAEAAEADTSMGPPPPPPTSAPPPSPAPSLDASITEGDVAKATNAFMGMLPAPTATRGRSHSNKRTYNPTQAQRQRSLSQNKRAKLDTKTRRQLGPKYFEKYAENSANLDRYGVTHEMQAQLEIGLEDKEILAMQKEKLVEVMARRNAAIAPKPSVDGSKKGGPGK